MDSCRLTLTKWVRSTQGPPGLAMLTYSSLISAGHKETYVSPWKGSSFKFDTMVEKSMTNMALDVLGQQPDFYRLYTQICSIHSVPKPSTDDTIVRSLRGGLDRLAQAFLCLQERSSTRVPVPVTLELPQLFLQERSPLASKISDKMHMRPP